MAISPSEDGYKGDNIDVGIGTQSNQGNRVVIPFKSLSAIHFEKTGDGIETKTRCIRYEEALTKLFSLAMMGSHNGIYRVSVIDLGRETVEIEFPKRDMLDHTGGKLVTGVITIESDEEGYCFKIAFHNCNCEKSRNYLGYVMTQLRREGILQF